MNYIGSKKKLSQLIVDVISDKVDNLEDKIFCDLFAGTGIIGRTFKPLVEQVISNDLEEYAYILNRNYIGNTKSIEGEILPEIEKEGFIYNNYCPEKSDRMYFTPKNGKLIDGARDHILTVKDKDLYFLYLCSLLENADKVANTASVYGAYLKKFKKSALNKISNKLHYPESGNVGIVYNEDANKLIKKIKGDVLYLDPPYNQRQYASNYHILNTISKNKEFIPKGVTGLPPDYNKSLYCRKNNVKKEFNNLILDANFEYIFLSYNNEGLMTFDDIKKIMSKYGEYSVMEINGYQRFKADTKRKYKAISTTEYIHMLKKT